MSVDYKGFSLMDEGEGAAPGKSGGARLTSNQVRVLSSNSDMCGRTQYPWRLPLAFVGVLAFIALIVGSVAVDKINHMDDDSSSGSSNVCPYGNILYGDPVYHFEGHYFQVVGSSSGALNWPEALRDANSRCYKGNQGYLANIQTEDENTFLYGIWRNHTSFSSDSSVTAWIGAADMNEEGIFEWFGPSRLVTGYPFYSTSSGALHGDYNNFAAGEPNEEGREDCVEMRSGQGLWNDRECYASAGFFFVEFGNPL